MFLPFCSCRKQFQNWWHHSLADRQLKNNQASFCFLKKLYMRKKQMLYTLFSIYVDNLQLAYNINKLHKTLGYWSRDMLNFDFWEKDLGVVSPPHSVHDFLRKMLFVLYSNNWPNFIARLLLLLENWPICILELLISQVVTS